MARLIAEQCGPRGLPIVALVGRPNTGKSTLFNRLTSSRRAVVAPVAGVTRDRNIASAVYRGRPYLLVDTGGFEADENEELGRAVRAQSLLAADEADAVVVVLDGRAGLNPLDISLLERLRRVDKPIFVAVNKIDTPKQEHLQSEFFALGVDVLHPISAEHGTGVGALIEAVLRAVPQAEEAEGPQDETVSVAIIGRPNVGKSSLLNRLVGRERAIVSAIPGTTRDSIDSHVTVRGSNYRLVDTAGVRRRPRVQAQLERVCVVRALHALERAEIALLLVDATEGVTEQDARISTYAWERGRGLVLVVNKWDAVDPEKGDRRTFEDHLDERFPSLALVPKVFLSARTGQGVEKLWTAVEQTVAAHRFQIQTARLNQVIARAAEQKSPPLVKGRRPHFFYAAQTGTAPPTVTVFAKNPEHVEAAYERYLTNRLRAAFPLLGTPVLIRFRAREGRRSSGDAPTPRRPQPRARRTRS